MALDDKFLGDKATETVALDDKFLGDKATETVALDDKFLGNKAMLDDKFCPLEDCYTWWD